MRAKGAKRAPRQRGQNDSLSPPRCTPRSPILAPSRRRTADDVDVLVLVVLDHHVDAGLERLGVEQNGGNVLERDARLRVVLDAANPLVDQLLARVLERELGHRGAGRKPKRRVRPAQRGGNKGLAVRRESRRARGRSARNGACAEPAESGDAARPRREIRCRSRGGKVARPPGREKKGETGEKGGRRSGCSRRASTNPRH